MRVLLINTSERIGGAAIAASRLMESLKNHGIKAKLLVRDKQTDQISVVSLDHNWRMVWKFVWERIVIWSANRFNKKNIFAVDIANTGTDTTSLPEFQQADVIHLHWINQGMLSLKNIEKILASGKPVVWTMHDMCPALASVTMPASAPTTSRNATTAPSSTEAEANVTFPTASSTKSRHCIATATSTSSPAAAGWKNVPGQAPSSADMP
mgnify:FL=1